MMALSDPEGYVAASSSGVAAIARLPIETVDRAISNLMAPDPRSRNRANGGRRLVEVDRGWHLPAIPYFRELARKEAEKARKRAWARANNSGRPTGASEVARRTETETETEREISDPPKPPKGGKSKRAAAPQTPIPADWAPSEAHKAYAAKHKLNLEVEADAFKGWAEGRTALSWNGTFTTRLANAVKFRSERTKTTKPEPKRLSDVMKGDAW